jgi:hypothetical protein
MPLYYGSADGKPDPHAVTLRRIEGFEQFSLNFGVYAHSRIFDAQAHAAAIVAVCLDQQFPGTIVYDTHGIRAVPQQIQNDLLNLNSIP